MRHVHGEFGLINVHLLNIFLQFCLEKSWYFFCLESDSTVLIRHVCVCVCVGWWGRSLPGWASADTGWCWCDVWTVDRWRWWLLVHNDQDQSAHIHRFRWYSDHRGSERAMSFISLTRGTEYLIPFVIKSVAFFLTHSLRMYFITICFRRWTYAKLSLGCVFHWNWTKENFPRWRILMPCFDNLLWGYTFQTTL